MSYIHIYIYMLYVMIYIYIYIHMNIHYCIVVSLFVLVVWVVCNQTFDCWKKKHIGKSCAISHCTYDSQLDHQFCWQKSRICWYISLSQNLMLAVFFLRSYILRLKRSPQPCLWVLSPQADFHHDAWSPEILKVLNPTSSQSRKIDLYICSTISGNNKTVETDSLKPVNGLVGKS